MLFLFGFAKSDLDNIGPDQFASFKVAATGFHTASDAVIAAEVERERLKEVSCGKKTDLSARINEAMLELVQDFRGILSAIRNPFARHAIIPCGKDLRGLSTRCRAQRR